MYLYYEQEKQDKTTCRNKTPSTLYLFSLHCRLYYSYSPLLSFSFSLSLPWESSEALSFESVLFYSPGGSAEIYGRCRHRRHRPDTTGWPGKTHRRNPSLCRGSSAGAASWDSSGQPGRVRRSLTRCRRASWRCMLEKAEANSTGFWCRWCTSSIGFSLSCWGKRRRNLGLNMKRGLLCLVGIRSLRGSGPGSGIAGGAGGGGGAPGAAACRTVRMCGGLVELNQKIKHGWFLTSMVAGFGFFLCGCDVN